MLRMLMTFRVANGRGRPSAARDASIWSQAGTTECKPARRLPKGPPRIYLSGKNIYGGVLPQLFGYPATAKRRACATCQGVVIRIPVKMTGGLFCTTSYGPFVLTPPSRVLSRSSARTSHGHPWTIESFTKRLDSAPSPQQARGRSFWPGTFSFSLGFEPDERPVCRSRHILVRGNCTFFQRWSNALPGRKKEEKERKEGQENRRRNVQSIYQSSALLSTPSPTSKDHPRFSTAWDRCLRLKAGPRARTHRSAENSPEQGSGDEAVAHPPGRRGLALPAVSGSPWIRFRRR